LPSFAVAAAFFACREPVGSPPAPPAEDAGVPDVVEAAAPAPEPLGYGLVFLSSVPHAGRFPPPDGAPSPNGMLGVAAFCRDLADRSPLPLVRGRRWRAWLSYREDADARSQLALDGGAVAIDYRRVDGAVVFPRGFDFDAMPDGGPALPASPIDVNERGQQMAPVAVWTGSLDNGRIREEAHCGGWNLFAPDAAEGRVGTSSNAPSWAGVLGNATCTREHHVFCVEDGPR